MRAIIVALIVSSAGCAYVQPTPGSTRSGISRSFQRCLDWCRDTAHGACTCTRQCLLDSHEDCASEGLEPTCALDWAVASGYNDPAWTAGPRTWEKR